MNVDGSMQHQWTATKGVTSSSSTATVNALSTAETNMNASYSSNIGASRGAQLQPQQQQQQPSPSSMDFAPSVVYPAHSYSVLDQILRDAMNGDSSPLSDDSNAASCSPMNITPRNGESPVRAAPQVLQRPFFHERPLSNVQTPHWITSADTPQYSCAVTENSLGPNTGYPSYLDAVTPAWQSLSKQSSSVQPGLVSPATHAAHTTPGLPQPLSIAAVSTLNPTYGSPRVSGSSTPAQQSGPFSSTGSAITPASSGDVVITGAVAAGAQPSSNAATHYKTKRCRHFDQSGWCPYQHRCVFAHGDREFALYTARKNEAASGGHPKTSQQVRDHIARNVNQLVEEYELAVAEAAANAKAKAALAAAPAAPLTNSAMTMVSNVSPAQSASQVSSAASHHSSAHMVATSPLATGSMPVPSQGTSANIPVFHYQPQQQHTHPHPPPPPQQQQPSFAMLGQQQIYISTTNNGSVQYTPLQFANANTGVGTTFTVLPANSTMQAAPQSLYIGHPVSPQSSQQQQQQQQPKQQPQVLFAVPSNTQGVYQLHSQPQPQQQQQQQIYLIEAPFFQTMQVSNSNASNAAAMQQQVQSSGHFHAYPASGYATSNGGTAFGTTTMIARYAQ